MKCQRCEDTLGKDHVEHRQVFELGGIYLNQFCTNKCLIEWIFEDRSLNPFIQETWKPPEYELGY